MYPLLGGGIAKRGGGLPIGSCSMCPVSRRSGCAFQPDARSLFMSRVLFSTIRVVKGLAGTGGDLRSNRVHGEDVGTIRADQGLPLRPSFAINFSDAMM